MNSFTGLLPLSVVPHTLGISCQSEALWDRVFASGMGTGAGIQSPSAT